MIRAGQLYAFQLFDVAESVDLARLTELLDVSAQPARLDPKPAIPSYVKYQVPPLHMERRLASMTSTGSASGSNSSTTASSRSR